MSSSLLPFALFALVASISPGPTNLLILAHGAHNGLRASVLQILAACSAAAGIVWLVGLGLGDLLLRHPLAQQAMGWAGALWLSLLAWRLFKAAGEPVSASAQRHLSAASAAALQLVNPKVWLMAVAVIGVFATPRTPVWQLALVFLLIALPCLGAWALLGVGSTRWLGTGSASRRFNQLLAALLMVSTWWAVLG